MKKFLKTCVVTILFWLSYTNAFAGDAISGVTCNGNVFTVTRTDANGPAIVYYRTQDISALDGIHYIGATGFIEFANGEKTKNIVVSELTPAITDINRYIYSGKSRKYMMFVWNNASTETYSCIRTIPTNADNVVNADIIYKNEVSALVSSQNEGVYYKSGEDYRYSYKDKYIPLTKLTNQFSTLRKNYLNALNQEYQYQLRLHFLAQPLSTTNEGYCYVQLFTGTEGDNTLNNSFWQNVYGTSWSASTNILGNFMFYISKSYGEDGGNIAADEGQEFCVPVKGVPNLRTTDLTNAWRYSSYWDYGTYATLKEQRSTEGESSSDKSSGYIEIPKETQSVGVRVASMGMYNTSTSKHDWYNWRFAAPTYYLRVYDDVAPKIVGVHINTSESYKTGDELRVSIEFDEIVDLYNTNYLVLYARINGVRYTLDYADGDRTNVINFTTKLKEPTNASVSGIIIDSLKNISIANSVRDLLGNYVENSKYIINKTISNFSLSKTYTVTYKNIGTQSADGYINGNNVTTYKYGKEVTLPTDVVRDGYTFGGWYASSSFTDRIYSISSSTSGNQTYYAKWIPNTYSVALHANGGLLDFDVTSYKTGDYIALPIATNCTRTGYTFRGWYETPDCSGSEVLNIGKTFYGNKEYYAKWTANTFLVDLNSGLATTEGTTSVSATYDAALPTIIVPTKTGYSFKGYYTAANGVGTQYYTASGKPTKDLCDLTKATTLYAYWTPCSYTLTLNDQEATVRGSQNVVVNFNDVLPSISVPSKTGYTFGGYYSEINGTGTKYYTEYGVENGSPWTTANNGTLYASWIANIYTIAYEVNGGNIASSEVETYTYGVGATLPTTVTKEGYEFQGWYATSYFDGEVRSEVTTTDLGNKTFYAKWENSEYVITLNTNGGTINAGDISKYTYGTGAVLPTNVTRTGYTFQGWYTDGDVEVKQISVTDLGAKEFFAHWSKDDYTITYNANGGTFTTTPVKTYNYGDEISLAIPSRAGYTFAGWYNNSNLVGTQFTEIEATETGDKDFWAKWEVNVYDVVLNANEGEINSGNIEKYTYDVLAILPSDVTRIGYEFDGWYDADDNKVTQISKGTIGNVEYTAKWSPKSYVVTLQTNNGTINVGNVTSYVYGEGATLPTDVTKVGYEFVGWFDNSSYEGGAVTTISITDLGNKNYWAKWLAEKYIVTFETNEGTINAGEITEYTYGVTAVLPTNVTREGYTFTGWYTNAECTSDVVSIISSTTIGDQTYYAGWSNSAYTVTLNTNDGIVTAGNVTSYVFGTEKDLPTAEQITKEGYTFVGWYDNSSYVGTVVTKIPATATGNKNFWAKWTVNVYAISLNANEGIVNSGNVTNYVYGNGANLPSDVTKTGYKFDGWYNVTDSIKQVVRIDESSTGDQAFFAKWTANSYNVILVVNEGTINEGNVESYVYGEGATLPSDVTKEGYTFDGWFANTSYTGGSVSSIAKNDVGDKQFWAKWTINEYEVTAMAANGVVEGAGSYEYKSTATLKATANDGYEFVNWSNGATDNKIQIVVTKDTTLTANFKEKEKVLVAGELSIPTMKTEREAAPIDLSGLFTTTEDGEVSYTAISSRPDIVSVSVVEGKLVMAVSSLEGEAEITVTATLPNGEKNSVSATASVVLACNIQVAETIKNVSCYGESDGEISVVVNNAFEPYTIQWIGEDNTSDTLPALKAGNYTIDIVDGEGCTFQKTYTVVQPQEIVISKSVINPTCANADGSITINVMGDTDFTYVWNNDTTSRSLTNVPKGEYNLVVTNNETGCKAETSVVLTEPDAPVVKVSNIVETACNENNGAIIVSGADNLIYKWNNGRATKNLLNVPAGDYTLVVTDENNCTDTLAVTVPSIALKQPEISLVTVSQETGKNLVVWLKENTDLIDYYTVYRETDAKDVYEELDQVPYSELSVYEDLEADPNIRAWRYKITATDVCGVETEMSAHHKTMHITKNMGMNNSYNLIWDEYEGLDFSSFIVYRKYKVGTKDMMDTITTLPSNVTSYTDENPVKRTTGYCVAIVLPEEINPKTQFMKAESGPFSIALSNIAEAENEEIDDPTGLKEVENAVVVYAIGHTIYVKNAEGNDITIYDNNGRVITNRNGESDMDVSFEVRLDGTYFVKVGNESFAVIVK